MASIFKQMQIHILPLGENVVHETAARIQSKEYVEWIQIAML